MDIPAGRPAAAVIAGSVVFCLVLFLPVILNDGDTLWQVRTGEWILDHWTVPHTDPFSFTAGDKRWFAHEWLAEALMALAFRLGGLPGVMALAAAACGVAAGLMLHVLRRFLSGMHAIEALVLAACLAAPSLLARPHLLAWPALVLWCGGLVTARANRTAPSPALLPAMLAWVNLHGSFMAGLLLPFAFALEALLDRGADRRRVVLRWGGFIIAAWATALLNPDGLAGVLFPFRMLGMSSLAWIGEWKPTDFSRDTTLEAVLLGGLAFGLSGRITLPPVRLVLILSLLHAALTHVRNQQLLGIVGTLALAEPVGLRLALGRAAPLGRAWRRVATGSLAVAAVALCLRLALPLGPERSGAAFAAVIDAVPEALRRQPVLNDYALGGKLIFAGVRPFIDSRADLYGDDFLARYHRIVFLDRAELERTLAEYHIAWTIVAEDSPVVDMMDRELGWHRLPVGAGVVVHVRGD
jgi:hypothetical protein